MRNRAAHDGDSISTFEAVAAKAATAALIVELRQGLSAKPEFQDLAAAMFLDFSGAAHDYDWQPVRVLQSTFRGVSSHLRFRCP